MMFVNNLRSEMSKWSGEPLEELMEEEFCQTLIINGINSQID